MMRLALLLACAVTGSGCSSGEEVAAAEPAMAATTPGRQPAGPILVELFTSQGCSSCPAADRVLSALPGDSAGVEVLPLAFHVDYWNDLGWADPFSRPEWSARQQLYAAAIAGGRLYTPQLVVQGARHVVGSDRGEIRRLIEGAERGASRARIAGRARREPGQLVVSMDASLASGSGADAYAAISESGLETRVSRGENQGRAMTNDFVVRRLEGGFRIEPGAPRHHEIAIPIDRAWRDDRLAVTLFVQEPGGMAILAAARAPIE